MLKTLSGLGVKATFFVVGSQVVQFPQVLKDAFDQGHEICIHTWSHHALTTMETGKIISELEWTLRVVMDVTRVRPNCLRPPFGDIDDRVRSIAKAMGLQIYHWNYDTMDYNMESNPSLDIVQDAGKFSARWKERLQGVVSLQHDLQQFTVAKAKELIEAVKGGGMIPMSIAQCLGTPQAPIKSPVDPSSPSTRSDPAPSKSWASTCKPGMILKYTLCLV